MVPDLIVFVIEDNKVFSLMIKSELQVLFEGRNVKFEVFATGEQCQAVIGDQEPDLVIVDYHLNSVDKNAMNGLQVIEMIRSQHKHVDFIIMTMDEHTELFLKSKELGIYDYLIKSSNASYKLNLSVTNWIKFKKLS